MNLVDPGQSLKDFIEYAKAQKQDQQQHDPPQETESRKRPREDDDDNMKGKCVLCATNPFSAAFIPCGHTCTCYACATALADRKCPICRKRALVQRLYVG